MKIRYKFSLLLLGTFLILFPLLTFIYYHNVRNTILDEVYSHLESISETKKIRLRDLIEKRFEILSLLSGNKTLIGLFNTPKAVPKSIQDSLALDILKRYTHSIKSFDEINLISPEGDILISTNAASIGQSFAGKKSFTSGKDGIKFWGEFMPGGRNRLYAYLSGPVSSGDRIIGIIVVKTNMSDIISLTDDYTGLGNTGETVLGARQGKTLLINSLRMLQFSSLKRQINTTDSALPMNIALKGREGIINYGRDYRNVEVIASTRFIPETRWGLVTKIDKKEALAPINDLIKILIFINLFALIAATVIAYYLGAFITRPIEELSTAVNEMKSGNLSARAKIISKDEIGTLAGSYNEMANNLQNKINDLDNFIYTASHDLKAPITNLEGLIYVLPELFRNKEMSQEEFNAIMQMITISIEKFKKTITDLTNISKVQRDIERDIEKVNIAEVISDFKTIMAQDIIRTGVRIDDRQIHCPSLYFSIKNFRSIIFNLLSNAIKYKSPDRTPEIRISTEEKDGYCVLTVQDNGLGIPEHKTEELFKMFKRFHSHVEGTGLGLYIVKRIIDNAGGHIEVESKLHETTFRVYLPLIKSVPSEAQ